MKKKIINNKIVQNKKSTKLIKKPIIASIVGVALLVLAFGSGATVNNYVLKSKIQLTPTVTPITPTITPTTIITSTQAPQTIRPTSNCSKYDFNKVKNGLLQLGMPAEQVEPYLTLWKSKGCPSPKTSSGSNQQIDLDNIEQKQRETEQKLEASQDCQEKMATYAKCLDDNSKANQEYTDCLDDNNKAEKTYADCVTSSFNRYCIAPYIKHCYKPYEKYCSKPYCF